MTARRAVVVGGGLAGCAAAVRLAGKGWAVTLLERHPRLGGKVSSFRHAGAWVDNGPHVATKACTAFAAFLRTIGADGKVSWQDRLDILFAASGGAQHRLRRWPLPAPLHLLPGLFGFDLLPWGARWGLGRVLAAARETPPGEATFLAWLRGLGQSEAAIGGFWEPLSHAVLNAGPGEADAAMGAWMVREAFCRSASAMDLGLFTVPQAELFQAETAAYLAARGGSVMTGCAAAGIAISERRAAGVTLAGGGILPAEGVVLAVPWDAAAGLLGSFAGSLRESARLRPGAIVSVTLRLDRPVLPAGVSLAALSGVPFHWAFSRTRLWALDPAEGEVMALLVSGAGGLADRPADEIEALAAASLSACFPAAGARVLETLVMREKRATFLPGPGHARLRPAPGAGPLPGLALAGAWTSTGWPATMEGAVRSGEAAAEAL